tara:strand:- start:22090 stop:22572 length:483 start_codon:yes stop_codon:yes gene_type:complete
MREIEIRPFSAADRDWLVQVHIDTYERDEGFDASFGVLVAQIVDDFLRDHDSAVERGWIVWDGDTRLGSIFCVRLDAHTGKLRLFQLVPQARGRGVGLRLLQTCTDFARSCGYNTIKLWSHKSHEAANALYLRNGWRIVEEHDVFNYGQHLVERVMQLEL